MSGIRASRRLSARRAAGSFAWVLVVVPAAGALWAGCGSGSKNSPAQSAPVAAVPAAAGDAGVADQSRCEFRGRSDREVSETAGPGAVQPNVRRVYQIVGTGDSQHKVLVCREVDTNLDGVKDVVRTYNEKGESLHEEADTNYDGRIDTWITFTAGRVSKEEIDSDFDGRPDVWKFYVSGKLSRIQRDTNRDGLPDQWEFYNDGRLERVGVDVDHDQHVDRWDHDEQQRLAEEAEAAKLAAKQDGGAPSAASPAPGAGPDGGVQGAADAGASRTSKRRKK